MPAELEAMLGEIERWVRDNQRDARRSTMRFWALKLPALLGTATSGLLALYDATTLAAVTAAVSAFCVGIDAANPGGHLRNSQLRAVYRLRALQHQMQADWRIGILTGAEPRHLAADIIKQAQVSWTQIGEDLQAAETALDARH